jgi:hypothetical protein
VLVGYELSQSVDMRLEADAPGTPRVIHWHPSRARHDHT